MFYVACVEIKLKLWFRKLPHTHTQITPVIKTLDSTWKHSCFLLSVSMKSPLSELNLSPTNQYARWWGGNHFLFNYIGVTCNGQVFSLSCVLFIPDYGSSGVPLVWWIQTVSPSATPITLLGSCGPVWKTSPICVYVFFNGKFWSEFQTAGIKMNFLNMTHFVSFRWTVYWLWYSF